MRSLVAAANFIKRRPGAVQARGADGGRTAISQRDLLDDFCSQRNEVLGAKYTQQFGYIGQGAEHVVLFDRDSKRAIKLTHPNRFGWSVAKGYADLADPFEYLRRLIYQNWFFGDDIDLVGVIGAEGHFEIVTSQPWIDVVESASESQVKGYFSGLGFEEVRDAEGGGMFYQRELDVVAADAHSRNVLVSSAGQIHPIDVVMGRPNKEFRARLLRGCENPKKPTSSTIPASHPTEEFKDFFGTESEI